VAYSQATLIKRIRKEVDDEPWETTASGSITNSATTLAVPDGTQWVAGDRLEWDDGTDEVALVQGVSVNNLTPLKRGHNGTTAVAHATAVPLLKNPEFEYGEIAEAISSTIEGLWPFVWAVSTTDITAVAGKRFYEMPAAFLAFIAATQDATVTAGKFVLRRYGAKGSRLPVGVHFQVPAAIAASGKALELPTVYTTPSATITVTYAGLVTDTVGTGSYTDIEAGLMATMMVHGAVAWLLESSEVERVKDDVDQGDVGVGPAARVRDASYFRSRFEQLRRQYNLKLEATAPRAGVWR